MSDEMWQVPDDLADRLRRTDYSEAWAREIERTAELRGILTDLIAELRAMPAACDVCCDAPGELAADRAEARLREVQGE
jgi:hypothetical protein